MESEEKANLAPSDTIEAAERVCCRASLASQLWPAPLRIIAWDPRRTAIAYAAVNGVFVGVGATVSGLAWLLTTPGLVVLVVVAVYAAAYNIARLVVYPGVIPNVRRGLEREIAREIRRNLVRHLDAYATLLKTLVHVHVKYLQSHTSFSPGLSVETISGPVLKERMTQLSRVRMQSCVTVFEPLAESLRAVRDAAKDRKLLYGGGELLEALEKVIELDSLLEELVISPALHSLETSGVEAFATNIASSVESLGGDVLLISSVETVLDLPAIQASRRGESELREAPWLILADLAAAVKFCAERTVSFEEVKDAPLKVDAGQVSPEELEMGLRRCSNASIVEEDEEDNESASVGTPASRGDSDTDTLGKSASDVESDGEDRETTAKTSEAAAVQAAAEGGTLALTRSRLSVLLEEFQAARRPMPAVANLDFMRIDLQTRMNGEQAWVSGYRGVQIDTMFLPAKHSRFASDQRTILVCNPNCGIYEFSALQNQWIHFYTDLGFNVLIFNYRGYGRSEGWPSPYALQKDGEALIDYLKRRKGVKDGWIGIHAESIGGVVACYLARHADKFGISFLVADRTLCDLPSTATSMLGSWAGIAIRCIGWQADNATNFLLAPNSIYRVCTCDPNDEIIANAASLKSGSSRRLIAAACKPMPSARDHAYSISCAAAQLLGAPRENNQLDFTWVRDAEFSVSFSLACIRLFEFQRQLAMSPLLLRNRGLISLLNAAVHVLWFTDGCCGESIGSPLSHFYHAWRAFSRPEKASPEQIEALITKAAANWVDPFQDWLANLMVWGADSPPVHDLVPSKELAQARRSTYTIRGRRVVCGALHPVPLNTTEDIFRALKDDGALFGNVPMNVDLRSILTTISEGLTQIVELQESIKDVRSQTRQESSIPSSQEGLPRDLDESSLIGNKDATIVSPSSSPAVIPPSATDSMVPNMYLLPLTCGHNGRMGPPPLRVLKRHLIHAGWLPRSATSSST